MLLDTHVESDYGQEVIIDCHGCDAATLTRESIGLYFDKLCVLIEMKPVARHFCEEEDTDDPKTCGFSAVQFILTSSITVHVLTKLAAVYVNVFSCRQVDQRPVRRFTEDWFGAVTCRSISVARR